MTEEFYPGYILVKDDKYMKLSPRVAEWCNSNDCQLEEIDPDPETGARRFMIVELPKPSFEEVKTEKQNENSCECERALYGSQITATVDDVELSFKTTLEAREQWENLVAKVTRGRSVRYRDPKKVAFVFKTTEQTDVVDDAVAIFDESMDDKFMDFDAQIEAAATVDDLNAIVIDYGIEELADAEDAE